MTDQRSSTSATLTAERDEYREIADEWRRKYESQFAEIERLRGQVTRLRQLVRDVALLDH